MLLKTLLQKIMYRFFLILTTVLFMYTGAYTPPSTEDPIAVSKPDEAKAVIAMFADPQISNYLLQRYPIFKAATEDMHNAECKFDAVVGVGDIAENGLNEEYQVVYDGISGLDTRYIMATGNHDIRLRLYAQSVKRFSNFANALNDDEAMEELHFSEVINGYKVIVLGSDRTEFEEAYLSDEQLEWLDDEVAAENGKPVFVILHQPLKHTHNVEVAWNSPFEGGGTVGAQSIALKAILSKYKNVILVSGHLHSGFGPDSYNLVDGIHSVNLPSLTIENKDGTYNNPGTGYIVEVYEDEIIFRARDFAKGEWVAKTTEDSSYDIVIPVEAY